MNNRKIGIWKRHATKTRNKKTTNENNKTKSRNNERNKVANANKVRNITEKGFKCKQASQHFRKGLQMQTEFATSPQKCIKCKQNSQHQKKGSRSFRPVLNQVQHASRETKSIKLNNGFEEMRKNVEKNASNNQYKNRHRKSKKNMRNWHPKWNPKWWFFDVFLKKAILENMHWGCSGGMILKVLGSQNVKKKRFQNHWKNDLQKTFKFNEKRTPKWRQNESRIQKKAEQMGSLGLFLMKNRAKMHPKINTRRDT